MASCIVGNTEQSLIALENRVYALLKGAKAGRKVIVVLAGAPGSGKSTMSAALISRLGNHGLPDVLVLPMDGFHYPQAVLSAFPDSQLAFQRRGAPFTFDAIAFVRAVQMLARTPCTFEEDPAFASFFPSFDHVAKDPVPGAICVPSTTRLVIIEGNYTLLKDDPWCDVAACADDKWLLDVPRYVLKQRISQRHIFAGIEATIAAAESRAEKNDLPNGDYMRAHSISPDLVIRIR